VAVTDSSGDDIRARRRAARRAASTTDILDAAERVFSEDGLRDGSLRRIAELSGYSTAAIYKFFDSKQHLVTETLNRRAEEYLGEVKQAYDSHGTPLERLHHVVEAAADYFSAQKDFSALIRQMQGGAAILGPALGAFAEDVDGRYGQAMTMMTDLVQDGQRSGEIRAGDPRALAHLASVLTNEFVLADLPLTRDEFHSVFDGALRAASQTAQKPGIPVRYSALDR
jgi:AcrR family transcriptional regulator